MFEISLALYSNFGSQSMFLKILFPAKNQLVIHEKKPPLWYKLGSHHMLLMMSSNKGSENSVVKTHSLSFC